MAFRDQLLGFITDYDSALQQFQTSGTFPAQVQQNMLDLRKEIRQFVSSHGLDYHVKISQGAPQWPHTPWLGIRDKRITSSYKKGVYIVYLLNRQTKDLYLTLNQGATEAAYYGNDNLPFTGISRNTNPETLLRLKKGAQTIQRAFNNKYDNYIVDIDCGSPPYNASTIFAIKYNGATLPNEQQLEDDLFNFCTIYQEYYDIFYTKANMIEDVELLNDLQSSSWDNLPNNLQYHGKKAKTPPTTNNGRKVYKRDKDVSKNALQMAGFHCEIDSTHPTFKRRSTGIDYTEPHHLIPLSKYDDFDNSLDVEENVVSLCSHCHNLIHYGEGAKELITILYEKRKDLLKSAGIEVSLNKLLEYYK